MARKKKEDSGGGAPPIPGWIVTYGDMMGLLLTFFILILSFSSIQEASFNKAIGSLMGHLGILGQYEYLVSLGKIVVPESTFAFMTRQMRQTTGELSRNLNFLAQDENIEVQEDDRGISIIIPAAVLFESGDDMLKPEAYPLLRKIGSFLYELKENTFMVEGHTDSTPINTVRFPSNWHLSSARAISVVSFFDKTCAIKPEKFTVSGRAEYVPVSPNDTEEHRAKNRRVVVLIQPTASSGV